MNKLLLIFDYFKEAYGINKQNKVIYKPQLALIGVNVVLLLFVGIGIYNWVGVDNIQSLYSMHPMDVLGFMLRQGFKLLALILCYVLLSVVVEAGMLNMYKKAVTEGTIQSGSFKEGLSKYFLKLLLGKLLIVICYLLSIPFYLLFGILTLTVGLTVIPLLAGVFLTMWKVSLVMNDSGIFAAIKDSFSFAYRNLLPLTVLQVIHWSFSHGLSSAGGGSGSNFNFPSGNSFSENYVPGVNSHIAGVPGMEEVIKVFKIVIAVLIPILSIATIAASVIVMIFEVFFTLALFVAYKNGFKQPEIIIPVSIESSPVIEESISEANILVNAEDTDSKEVEQ